MPSPSSRCAVPPRRLPRRRGRVGYSLRKSVPALLAVALAACHPRAQAPTPRPDPQPGLLGHPGGAAPAAVAKGPSAPGPVLPGPGPRPRPGRESELRFSFPAPGPNSARLILQEDHLARTVAVQAWLSVGAADEAPDQVGVAHLLERLLFYEQAAGPLARLRAGGGEVASWTTPDQTVFHALAAAERWRQALDLVLAALGAPEPAESAQAGGSENDTEIQRALRFDDAAVERQRQGVLAELREQGMAPQALRALFESAFGGSGAARPYHRPPLGTPESLRRLDRAATVAFFRAHYAPRNLVLVVTGDFDAAAVRAHVAAELPRTLVMQGPHPLPPRLPAAPAPERPADSASLAAEPAAVRLHLYDGPDGEAGHAQVLLGLPGYAAGTREAAALDLAAVLLGYGESSRIGRALSRSPRLWGQAEPQSRNFTGREAGLLLVGATLSAVPSPGGPANPAGPQGAPGAVGSPAIEEAARLLVAEVQALADKDRGKEIAPAELARAQRVLLADAAYLMQTPAGRARRIGFFASLGLDEHAYQHEVAEMTPGTLVAALSRALRGGRATLLASLARPRGELRARDDEELRRRLGTALSALAPAPPPGTRTGKEAATRALALGPPRPRVLPDGVLAYQLSSGAQLLVLPDPGVEVVALVGLWPGGLRSEDERSAGAHQLLARVFPRAPRLRSAEAMARELDGLFGSLVPVLDRDSFGLRAELPSGALDQGLQLFLDCIQQPAFTDAEIDRERRALLQEQRGGRGSGLGPATASDPSFRAAGPGPGAPPQGREEGAAVSMQLLREALFGRHPYRLEATPQSLAGLSRRRLLELYRRAYPLSKLTLVAVGDVEPDELAGRIEARLAPLVEARPVPPPPTPSLPPSGAAGPPQRIVRYGAGEQAHLMLGFPAPGLRDPARYAVEVLFELLAGRGSEPGPGTGAAALPGAGAGRLAEAIRARRGLAFSLQGVLQLGVDPGLLGFYLATSPGTSDAAYASLRDELHRLADRPPAPEELRLAKENLTSRFALRRQRRIDRALGLAQDAALQLGGRSEGGYPAGIQAVRAADVQDAARRYLDEQRAVLAAVLPESLRPLPAQRGRTAVQLALRGAASPPPKAPPPARAPARPPARSSKGAPKKKQG